MEEHILMIDIPPMIVTKGLEEVNWTGLGGLNGWQLLDGKFPYWTGDIDLSGYTRDHKTFFPKGAVLQEGPYIGEVGCDGTIHYTVVSTVPVDIDSLKSTLSSSSTLGMLALAGLDPNQEQQNWATVLFAESKLMVSNTNISPNTYGICQAMNTHQTGSLTPTATDRLFVCSIVLGLESFTNVTKLILPAKKMIMPGTVDEEPDVEYLMRLKRSLELANQV